MFITTFGYTYCMFYVLISTKVLSKVRKYFMSNSSERDYRNSSIGTDIACSPVQYIRVARLARWTTRS